MRKLLLSWFFMCSILLISLHKLEVFGKSCLGSQQSLMLQLKDSLTFDRALSRKLLKWNNSLDCCSWEGVSCEEGRVTSLDLSGVGIFGVLNNSSTLFNLQHLERLDLSFNNFFGSRIPSRIGSLTSLSYLNLSNAGFVGQIPEELSRLTRLVTLDISADPFLRNPYLKLGNPNLSMLIQNLSKLEQLYLDGVNMSKHGSQWSRALSSSVPNLRVLSLIDCSLSGPLDPSLEKLQALSIIRLDRNNLSSPVPEFFSSFSNLTSLSLLGCGLQGIFPGEIFQIPILQILDISFNEFLQGTLPEFRKNNSLQELFVRDTNFSGSLPTSIGNLQNLSRLDLRNCQFSGILPRFMEQLTQLLYVDLSNNKFTGRVPSFKMSKNLTHMILSHNSFSGTITPSHWEGLNKLGFLDLQNNLLSGNINSSLFTLPLLEVVLLSSNQFKGQLPEFQNVSSLLGTLDLSSNNLEGPIPMSIYLLRNLSVLILSFNKLNGTIQLDHVKAFHRLRTLDLSYNNLTVNASGLTFDSVSLCFPKISTLLLASCKLNAFPDLRNQPNLVHLDLSNNQIGEEVPHWIWGLGNGLLQNLNLSHNNLVGIQEPYRIPTFLTVLDLNSNQLQGKFPNPLSLASYIDFSSNNFTSSIPADIGDYLNYTIYFSISNNSLTGDIPESICNAGYLQVLDLSYNGLSSTIPRCVLGMSQTLGVLNLRGNKFSGHITDVFPVICALETLDLNGNLIQGQIPKSLSNCRRLEVLDLGNNMLTGHFPCLLNSISTLRVLVMRSNRFQGNLGCPNTTGFWENLQIIDLARNNFNGKIAFLTRWKAMRDDDDDAQQKIKHLQFVYLELSSSRYYGDAVTFTFKGLDMKLQKIRTLFTSLDLSCNNFSGPIPEELGQLRALYILNLSHNALTGEIPPSTGNLQHLESLDLSSNFLSGVIPETLETLNFLSFLNLSFNHLEGQIPSGNQLQTFSNDSYAGNEALCGFPLAAKCSNAEKPTNNIETNSSLGIDSNIISFETGFIFGFGGVVWPLLLCRQFRRRYYQRVDDIAFMTFPRIYQRFM